MRIAALILVVTAFLQVVSGGATVLEALKVLPKDELESVARIEAYDGSPVPERWHILVHEPESENGVKEHVVANGALATSREISQFAEKLSRTDVIGQAFLQVDSDTLAELAQDYAEANDVKFATLSYQLARESAAAAPAWRVRCMDEEGKVLATLVVTSQDGTVASHEGFASAPAPGKEKSKSSSVAKAKREDSPRKTTRSRPSRRDPEPIASRERMRSRNNAQRDRPPQVMVRRAEPMQRPRNEGNLLQRLFRSRN